MNSPRFEFVEDAFGAVIHELGHALGLPHDYRDNSVNIMGGGFRNIRRNLVPANKSGDRLVGYSKDNKRFLMCSRYLSKEIKRDDYEPPILNVSLKSTTKDSVVLTVQTSDNIGLRALLVRDMARDAPSVIDGRELKGKRMTFRQVYPRSVLKKARTPNLRISVIDAGGNMSHSNVTLAK